MRTMKKRYAETAAWGYAAALSEGSTDDIARGEVLEAVLVAEGGAGIADLLLAGPTLGGLDERDVAAILASVDRRMMAERGLRAA